MSELGLAVGSGLGLGLELVLGCGINLKRIRCIRASPWIPTDGTLGRATVTVEAG